MISPANFQCTYCGKCCMHYTVKLNDTDMKRITSLGHKPKDFAEPDDYDKETGSFALQKQKNGWCVFLKKSGEKYLCSIHNSRPDICRKYPFFDNKPIETCIPQLQPWQKS